MLAKTNSLWREVKINVSTAHFLNRWTGGALIFHTSLQPAPNDVNSCSHVNSVPTLSLILPSILNGKLSTFIMRTVSSWPEFFERHLNYNIFLWYHRLQFLYIIVPFLNFLWYDIHDMIFRCTLILNHSIRASDAVV